jgi:muramoyltetrapeptide carboxypeptidase
MSAPSLLYPPRFAVGDTIGIAAPASPPDKPDVIEDSIARFGALGFKVRAGANLRKREGYLAGSDQERAADINALFADPEVKAIFALRGGYGSCRILPLLDYDLIRANPKSFVGYSDITAMQLAILVKTGLVTYHGSNASSALAEANIAMFREMLIDDVSHRPPVGGRQILFARRGPPGDRLKSVVSGRIEGQLLGGNMTCLLRLLATPYAPDFRGAILFLEDTGEKAYRVDGMFTHLRLAGILDQIGGLVLGQFDHTDPAEQNRVAQCLQREAEHIGVPCVSGAPIGHFPTQIIVPQGASAELDADNGTLQLLPEKPGA